MVGGDGKQELPFAEVEGRIRGGVAALVVVELDPDLVELGLGDDSRHLEPVGGGRALGCGGDDHILADSLDTLSESLNHGDVWQLVGY